MFVEFYFDNLEVSLDIHLSMIYFGWDFGTTLIGR
jgi:hypothetical protein